MKRKPVLVAVPKYEACGSCVGGWVLVWDTPKAGWSSPPKAKRCWCWTKYQEDVAELRKQAS